MPNTLSPQTSSIVASIRFVKGYRYLDRCGEALVKLVDVLDDGWIPTETTPSSGRLRNYRLGLFAQFQSESMTVSQSEFISFEHFRDETCKVYEILWRTFDIEQILAPALRVVLQAGFEGMDAAEEYVRGLEFCTASDEVVAVLGGRESSVRFTLCTEDSVTWQDSRVAQRRRLEVGVIRQEKQPDFDERVMRRLALVPMHQREAVGTLMRLRRQHPQTPPIAAQFDLESTYESEFRSATFDLPTFIEESWQWARGFQTWVESR